jgi:uncharacterized membrane protein YcaP (DUF421 family)
MGKLYPGYFSRSGGVKVPGWLEITLRTLTAIVVMFIATKVMGKRQVSELSLFEYITGITIGSIAAYISLDLAVNWYLGIIALGVWAFVALGIEYLQLKSKRFRDLVDGKETILVERGQIKEDALRKERLTIDEFMQLLRKKNVFHLADVEMAIMETSGDLTVQLKKEHRPLTAKTLKLPVTTDPESQIVIMDGEILDDSLARLQLNRKWLMRELRQRGMAPGDVFICEADSSGKMYLVAKQG